MRWRDYFEFFLAAIALLFLWMFIDEREKATRKDELIEKLYQDNQRLKEGYLDLLIKHLNSVNALGPNALAELEQLKGKIDHLDTAVHYELDSVIKLVSNGEWSKAVRDLAKIVENALKRKAQEDKKFKRKPMLHELLEFAKENNWITIRQYENGILLKEIRNKESHELNVNEETRNLGLSIFGGVDLIYALK
jgi:cell division protein ZapA (FtsZ GTPase activity inhibitor)